jgi:hypothetical protein
MEHWEEQDNFDETVVPESITLTNEDNHTAMSHYYISIFAIIRILCLGCYIFFEAKKFPLYTYMQANWMGWPSRNTQQSFGSTNQKLKTKLLQLQPWNSFMLNLYSI